MSKPALERLETERRLFVRGRTLALAQVRTQLVAFAHSITSCHVFDFLVPLLEFSGLIGSHACRFCTLHPCAVGSLEPAPSIIISCEPSSCHEDTITEA